MKRTMRATVLVTLAAGAGCGGIQPRALDAPDGSRARVISAATVERSGARTMWEAVKLNVKHAWFTESSRGDPQRIRTRGASTLELVEDMRILVDGVLITDLGVLDKTPARHIEEIRVMSGIDATTYYGSSAGDGVILIRTKQGT